MAWLGLAWLGLAWLGLAWAARFWFGAIVTAYSKEKCLSMRKIRVGIYCCIDRFVKMY
jgi:hypothetical protein